MSRSLQRFWKLPVLLAVLMLAALAAPGPSVEAIPGCGECVGGTTGTGWSCGGAHTNCSECTVCAK